MNERTPITLEELESVLNQDEKIVRVSNRIVLVECWLTLESRKFEECYFVNCKFEFGVHIRMNGVKKCSFVDCEIEFGLHIHKAQAEPSTISPDLLLGSSKFDRLLLKSVQLNELRVFNCSFEDIYFEEVDIEGEYFTIWDSSINDDFTMKQVKVQNKMRFDGLTTKGSVDLVNVSSVQFYVARCHFKDDFDCDKCSGELEIDRVVVEGDTYFLNCDFRRIKIQSSRFTKVLTMNFTDAWNISSSNLSDDRRNWAIDYIGILSSAFPGGLDIGLDWAESQRLPVGEFEFLCTAATSGDVFFNKLEIGEFRFKGINREASFHLFDCDIAENFMFTEFVNQGKIVMNNVSWKTDSQVYFNRAVVGPAYFTAVDFNDAKGFHFYDSDISQISFVSTHWPIELQKFIERPSLFSHIYWKSYFFDHWLKFHWFNLDKNNDQVIYYVNRRELYRQLKSASEKMQDRVCALGFQAIEMKAYEKQLQLTQRPFNLERMVLFLSRTNGHGQNWWRPVWLALLISLLFFIPIIIGIDPEITSSNWVSSSSRVLSWYGTFPQLLNPVHSLDKMTSSPETIHPLTWWFDYAHRIVMAFFIFQTVSAFRKYVK